MSADDVPHCLNDHTHGPATGETLNGMADENEVVNLLCYNCLTRSHT